MRAGNLRVSYWAVDEQGERVELLASVEQGADGRYPEVFTSDARAVDAVLELRDGAQWRPVRARRVEANPTPHVLPLP